MDKEKLKQATFENVKSIYKDFLRKTDLKPNTINTASNDTFYLWKKAVKTVFGMQ